MDDERPICYIYLRIIISYSLVSNGSTGFRQHNLLGI